MLYDAKGQMFFITPDELVKASKRRIFSYEYTSALTPSDILEGEEYFSYAFDICDTRFLLFEKNDLLGEGRVENTVSVPDVFRISKTERAEARGVGFIRAFLSLGIHGGDAIEVYTRYIGEETGEEQEEAELVKRNNAVTFFNKCLVSLSIYSAPEIDRQRNRIPSMHSFKFPYTKAREGQRDFIETVYRNLARSGVLFASAPTGTGKTVSTIYPAIKCIGRGRADKAFYLTPKTTTQQAAADCLDFMAKQGLRVRAIRLYSKDRCCIEGRLCKNPAEKCKNQNKNALPDAVLALFKENNTVVGADDCQRVAKEYGVCPYELSLTYSELCDVIICDVNYLFDPYIHLKRYFERGGRYAVLIDEAHNLVDRARDMFSSEISTEKLKAVLESELLGEHSKIKEKLSAFIEKIEDTVLPYLKDEIYTGKDGQSRGATTTSNLPIELIEACSIMKEGIDAHLWERLADKTVENKEELLLIKDLKECVEGFYRTLLCFDDAYRIFLYYDCGSIRIKLFCLDTGKPIRQVLNKIGGAVFFSATLSPIEYFRSLLGGDRASEVFEGASPFAPEILSVSIVDTVSTRYSERGRTLPSVCRVIASTLSARRGNYIVFSPSFEYAEALYEAFKLKYPKINCILQRKDMTYKEKEDFLAEFKKGDGRYLVAFCVLGGIYSEGIDLSGESLIGAVVVGIGLPTLSYEREAMASYYQEKYDMGKEYAYLYPGINRVLQAAGRVIRQESDRGVIVLVDDRFKDPIYKKSIPDLWRDMKFVTDPRTLKERLDLFWQGVDNESK